MFAMQYTHRLPADYDMGIITQRAALRGPGWEATPGLVFKGFVGRVKGAFGAPHNVYASIYLWHDAAAAAALLSGEGYNAVTDSFGRPPVESWLPLHARRGPAQAARSIYREDVLLPDSADRAALCAAERARVDRIAAEPGTVAVVTALDPLDWRFIRLTVSAEAPSPSRPGVAYQVFYLAKPGLETLA